MTRPTGQDDDTGRFGDFHANYVEEHAKELARFFQDLTLFRDGEEVRVSVMMQTPQLAYSDIIAPRAEGRPALPRITFILRSTTFVRDHRYLPQVIPYITVPVSDGYLLSGKPQPVILEFEVSLWCKFHEDLDIITTQIFARFTPFQMVFLRPYGLPALMTINEIINQHEIRESEERYLRRVFDATIEGWMILPGIEVPKIEQIEAEDIEIKIP